MTNFGCPRSRECRAAAGTFCVANESLLDHLAREFITHLTFGCCSAAVFSLLEPHDNSSKFGLLADHFLPNVAHYIITDHSSLICHSRKSTMFENYSKSLIQNGERSELRFHFERTKVNQNWKILIRRFWWFSNTTIEKSYVKGGTRRDLKMGFPCILSKDYGRKGAQTIRVQKWSS